MRKILIHMSIVESGEYDIFHMTDPEKWDEVVNNKYGRNCFNVGNKLWFQAIISEISTEDNQIFYYNSDMTFEEINSDYDMVIAPMANVFSEGYTDLLDKLATHFEKVKIPVYVIACGVQADNYDYLDELCTSIGEKSKRFIRAIYNTGGEFALRGFFTKEFFKKLGFNSAVVTGCPSLFQFGADFAKNINTSKVSIDEFKPAFNGVISDYLLYMKEYSSSEFFDQNHYYNILNSRDYLSEKSVKQLLKDYSYEELLYISNNRVKLFPDMVCWMNYLKNNDFAFSFGERIHGNIMPILAGIPALVIAHDSRTREMAEYFNIPTITKAEINNNTSLYDLYLNTDYSKFVNSFSDKYNRFEQFLISCGVVSKANTENVFMSCDNTKVIINNIERLQFINSELLRKNPYLKIYSKIAHYIR